jgi:hypothetical protein
MKKSFLVASIFTLLLSYFFLLRLSYWHRFWHAPLESDAKNFQKLSSEMTFFYQTTIREPFFILIVRGFDKLLGRNLPATRLQSFVFSLALVSLVFFFSWRTFNLPTAFIAFILVGVNRYLLFSSIRGLRLEFFVCLTFLYLWSLFLSKKLPLAGLLGGLLILVRVSAISIVGVSLIYFLIFNRKRVPWRELFLLLLIISVIIIPFFLNSYSQHGDAFFLYNRMAKFWRNQEFHGQPGFPTTEEVRQNGYCGAEISLREYIFGLHTFKEVLGRYLKGYFIAFSQYIRYTLKGYSWLVIVGILGMLKIVISPQGYIVWALIAQLFPFAFILPLTALDVPKGVDLRFVMHIYPLFAICIAQGSYLIGEFFLKRLQDKKLLLRRDIFPRGETLSEKKASEE